MVTTNDIREEKPPITALERQVQTLATIVEHLTKQNPDLEEQLRQKNAGPNNQREDQEDTSAAQRDREGLEGSNALRRDREGPEGSNTLSRLEQ